jgi:hypothetical protein
MSMQHVLPGFQMADAVAEEQVCSLQPASASLLAISFTAGLNGRAGLTDEPAVASHHAPAGGELACSGQLHDPCFQTIVLPTCTPGNLVMLEGHEAEAQRVMTYCTRELPPPAQQFLHSDAAEAVLATLEICAQALA